MPRYRRRRDGGDLAIITLPYQHPYAAIAYVVAAMLFDIFMVPDPQVFDPTNTATIMAPMINQIGHWAHIGVGLMLLNGILALGYHVWQDLHGYAE
jgi:hypothetical protein